MTNILIVDDDRALGRSLQIHFQQLGHDVRVAATAAEGLVLQRERPARIVFLDLRLPDDNGLHVLEQVSAQDPACAVIMISGAQDMDATISAIRQGAFDFIRKPLDLDEITIALEKATRHLQVVRNAPRSPAREEPVKRHEIVGRSRAIVDMIKQIGLLSRSRVTVLIDGESGTGKELVARAIHEATSPGEPFIAVNCSAIVPSLLESELFGHERGAFTGAERTRAGKLELAAGGTAFFDEIGDLPLDLQAKVLRALQEREFERVGSVEPIPLRARILSATNRNLEARVREGKFREDLFFRLAVARIVVPPLRERREDIPLIAGHLLTRIGRELEREAMSLSDAALTKLSRAEWPGNVRQLENVLHRAAAVARVSLLEAEALQISEPCVRTGGDALGDPTEDGSTPTLRDVERRYVGAVLERTGWNVTQAARVLDVSPTTLRKKIADYGLIP